MRWCRRRTINMREVHGVGQAAPDLSTRHAAPGGDACDPWGSAHGEEDRCGRGSHGRCSDVLRRSESLHVFFKAVTVAIATTTTAAVTSFITFAVLLTAVVLPIFAILGGNDN